MSRASCFVFVVAMVAVSCQSFVVNVCAEEHQPLPADNAVANVQQVIIRTKLIEINRSKLRRLGLDFAVCLGDVVYLGEVSVGQAKKTDHIFRLGSVVGSPIVASSIGLLDALCQNEVARILAEPTIATIDGRSATLSSGYTIKTEGAPGIEEDLNAGFIGTKLEVLPHLVANNKIRIKYHLDYSHLREGVGSEKPGYPKIGHRVVDTTFEVSLGETFVGGGLISKVHTGDQTEEIELVLLVTPELAGGSDTNVQPAAHVSQAISSSKKTR